MIIVLSKDMSSLKFEGESCSIIVILLDYVLVKFANKLSVIR